MALILTADVGNSKTHLAVADETGRLVGLSTGPGGSPQTLGVSAAVELLCGLARQATGTDRGYTAAVLAVAGVDLPDEETALHAAVCESGLAERVVVCNDTMALLRSGTTSTDGIAVVAGAGTNCVGRYRNRQVRFHSLGRLTGDWGGGNDLGEEAVGLACRAEDGRGPATVLAQQLPARFGLSRPLELAEAVHHGQIPRGRLVELAPLVLAAADTGDGPATRLVDRLAGEVVDFAAAAVGRLGCSLAEVPVILGGGLLRSGSTRLHDGIRAGMVALHPQVQIRVPTAPPVVGALALALDEANGVGSVPLSVLADQVVARLC